LFSGKSKEKTDFFSKKIGNHFKLDFIGGTGDNQFYFSSP